MDSETTNESARPQGEEIKPRNFFSRLGGIYFSPGRTFREIAGAPRVLIPMIALIILGLLAGYYIAEKVDIASAVSDQLEKAIAAGRMTKDQMEQQLPFWIKVGKVQVIVGSAISSLLFALIISAVFKLITLLVGAENRFKSVFSVTLYSMIAVSIVQSILLVVILFFKSPGEVSVTSVRSVVASNLGALLEPILGEDSLPKFLMKLFSWVDVFAIWIISLLAIGYSAVSKRMKTSTAATWIGGIYLIIAIIAAAIGS